VAKYREWEDVSRPWDRQFIVGLSECAHLNDRGQALQAGMDMFYPKPMTTKTLSVIQADFDVMARTEMLNQLVTSRKQGW
jgi:CheY-like chemotaxis protein